MLIAMNDNVALCDDETPEAYTDQTYRKAVAALSAIDDWSRLIKWLDKYSALMPAESNLKAEEDAPESFPFGSSKAAVFIEERSEIVNEEIAKGLHIVSLHKVGRLWAAVKTLSGMCCCASEMLSELPAILNDATRIGRWYFDLVAYCDHKDLFLNNSEETALFPAYLSLVFKVSSAANIALEHLDRLDEIANGFSVQEFTFDKGHFYMVKQSPQKGWYTYFARAMVYLVINDLYFTCDYCHEPRFKARKDKSTCSDSCRVLLHEHGPKPKPAKR